MMSVKSEIDEMQAALSMIGNTLEKGSEESVPALPLIRKNLVTQLNAFSQTIEEDPLLAGQDILRRELRSRLSELRSALSTHQASWPAIRARDDQDGYRKSADSMLKKHKAFLDWAKRELDAL